MRRTLMLALAAVLALALVTTADAAKKKKHKITLNSTIQAHGVNASGNPIAGTLSDPTFGSGAAVYTTGTATMVNGKTVEPVTFEAFAALGTVKGSGTVTVTPGTGSAPATVIGTGKITSGTGKYKGAKGSITTTGTLDSMSYAVIHVTGTVTY